jgi:hypothetical protein
MQLGVLAGMRSMVAQALDAKRLRKSSVIEVELLTVAEAVFGCTWHFVRSSGATIVKLKRTLQLLSMTTQLWNLVWSDKANRKRGSDEIVEEQRTTLQEITSSKVAESMKHWPPEVLFENCVKLNTKDSDSLKKNPEP